MLFLFCLVAVANGFVFMSMASVANVFTEYHDTSFDAINRIAEFVTLAYVVILPISTSLYHRLGLRWSIVIAATLQAAGSILRAAPSLCTTDRSHSLPWVYGGSFLVGAAAAFYIGLPTWQSFLWFEGKEQNTATAVAVLATTAGCGLGFLIPPLVIDIESMATSVPMYHLVTAAACILIAVLVVVFYQADPLGTGGLGTQREQRWADSPRSGASNWTLKNLWNRNLILVAILFGVATSIHWTFALILSSALHDSYTSREVGFLGVLYWSAGLLGTWAAGVYLDRCAADPPYRAIAATVLATSVALLVTFTLAIEQTNQLKVTALIIFSLGTFLPSVQPVLLELAVEYSFEELPLEISGSMCYLVASLLSAMLPSITEAPSELAANVGIAIAIGLCATAVFALPSDYKRVQQRRELYYDTALGAGATDKEDGTRSPGPVRLSEA
jgi:MFS family permease